LTPRDREELKVSEGAALEYFRQYPGKLSHSRGSGKLAFFQKISVELIGITAPGPDAGIAAAARYAAGGGGAEKTRTA
jgi:hypothetical protein